MVILMGMGKLLGKFDFVLILLQCFGLQFVFTGIYRLFVAYNSEENRHIIITAYIPNPDLWNEDFTSRRKK